MHKTAAEPNPQGSPYCGRCGYRLGEIGESTRCPECGGLLVDVLMRPGMAANQSRRYTSDATIFGMPVICVALGPDPSRDEIRGRAKGLIAVGDVATGGVAIGGRATGVVAIGGVAIGGAAFGGVGLGLLTGFGGVATGLLVSGGVAIGGFSYGGVAVGAASSGGVAVGYATTGGVQISPASDLPGFPTKAEVHDASGWFFGSWLPPSAQHTMGFLSPTAAIGGVSLLLAAVIGAFALAASRRRPSQGTQL